MFYSLFIFSESKIIFWEDIFSFKSFSRLPKINISEEALRMGGYIIALGVVLVCTAAGFIFLSVTQKCTTKHWNKNDMWMDFTCVEKDF